jgi:hypothetical protein
VKIFRVFLCTALLSALLTSASGQSRKSGGQQQSQGSGIAWAMQAMQALTGGNPVSSVSESGSVIRTLGSDQQQGTGTLQSSGVMNSEVDITTSVGVRSEIRMMSGSYPNGAWIGFDGSRHSMPLHNCWTDAVWFFPALSLLADFADPNLVFEDLGQQQYGSSYVEDIRVYRTAQGLTQDQARELARLSTVHYYLDSQTAIPVALSFATHADHDLGTNIPVAVLFSDYRPVGGILAPFQITTSFNGTPLLQITISSVTPNRPIQGPKLSPSQIGKRP